MTVLPLYLDAASTTPCAPDVVTAMQPYWSSKFGNAAAAGIEGRRAAQVVDQARQDIAALIGGQAAGITLTSGATEANFLALAAAAAGRTDAKRNEILIGATEHDSVVAAAQSLTSQGYVIKTIPVNTAGEVTVAALGALLSPCVFMVSVMTVNHETGVAHDIPALCRLARAAGALFHTDAVQAAGKMRIDAAAWGVDMMTLCAHKIYGPQGIGALYVRPSPPVRLVPVMGGQVLRAGTVPLALAAGFGVACRLAAEGAASHAQKIRDVFLSAWQAAGIDFAVNGVNAHLRVPHILNVRIAGVDAADMMLDLSARLTFSTGAACRSQTGRTSPVLAAMGLDALAASQSIRVSYGHDLSVRDAQYAAQVIADYVLKKTSKSD